MIDLLNFNTNKVITDILPLNDCATLMHFSFNMQTSVLITNMCCTLKEYCQEIITHLKITKLLYYQNSSVILFVCIISPDSL